MDRLPLTFPASGVLTRLQLPPLVAFIISLLHLDGGISGTLSGMVIFFPEC
jgi:hypothetical protein